jgi:hypothetical protein
MKHLLVNNWDMFLVRGILAILIGGSCCSPGWSVLRRVS